MGACVSFNQGKLKFQLDDALAIEVALVNNDPSTAHKLIADHVVNRAKYDAKSQESIDKMAVRVLKTNILPSDPPPLIRS